jgi:hypothetical protein
MPQARINGQSVEVTMTTVEQPVKDVIYTISGEGSANLRATLVDVNADPSVLANGSFTIKRSSLLDPFMDMPFLKMLDKKLAAAAGGLEVT